MPLHKGHIALIKFGVSKCDILYVMICVGNLEPIDKTVRQHWISETFFSNKKIVPIVFEYDETILRNTSVSSLHVAKEWAVVIKENIPRFDIIFSSEKYGDYLASLLDVKHICFDISRKLNDISSTEIRNKPLENWNYLANSAKPFYTKKIVLLGTESTGKSTITKKLAVFFNTVFVEEMARKILEKTDECTYNDLEQIAVLHANAIKTKLLQSNRLLFIDTDINITKSYSLFLFNKTLVVPEWIEKIGKSDLYFFLEPDCPYIQDGTRLNETERTRLSAHHKKVLLHSNIEFISINGNWEERLIKIKKHILELLNKC